MSVGQRRGQGIGDRTKREGGKVGERDSGEKESGERDNGER